MAGSLGAFHNQGRPVPRVPRLRWANRRPFRAYRRDKKRKRQRGRQMVPRWRSGASRIRQSRAGRQPLSSSPAGL